MASSKGSPGTARVSSMNGAWSACPRSLRTRISRPWSHDGETTSSPARASLASRTAGLPRSYPHAVLHARVGDDEGGSTAIKPARNEDRGQTGHEGDGGGELGSRQPVAGRPARPRGVEEDEVRAEGRQQAPAQGGCRLAVDPQAAARLAEPLPAPGVRCWSAAAGSDRAAPIRAGRGRRRARATRAVRSNPTVESSSRWQVDEDQGRRHLLSAGNGDLDRSEGIARPWRSGYRVVPDGHPVDDVHHGLQGYPCRAPFGAGGQVGWPGPHDGCIVGWTGRPFSDDLTPAGPQTATKLRRTHLPGRGARPSRSPAPTATAATRVGSGRRGHGPQHQAVGRVPPQRVETGRGQQP